MSEKQCELDGGYLIVRHEGEWFYPIGLFDFKKMTTPEKIQAAIDADAGKPIPIHPENLQALALKFSTIDFDREDQWYEHETNNEGLT